MNYREYRPRDEHVHRMAEAIKSDLRIVSVEHRLQTSREALRQRGAEIAGELAEKFRWTP